MTCPLFKQQGATEKSTVVGHRKGSGIADNTACVEWVLWCDVLASTSGLQAGQYISGNQMSVGYSVLLFYEKLFGLNGIWRLAIIHYSISQPGVRFTNCDSRAW